MLPFTSSEQSLRLLTEVGCLPPLPKHVLTDSQMRAALADAIQSPPAAVALSGLYEFAGELVHQQVQGSVRQSGGRRVALGLADRARRQLVASELNAFAPVTIIDSPQVLRTLLASVSMTALITDAPGLSGYLAVARPAAVPVIVVAADSTQALQIRTGSVHRVVLANDPDLRSQLVAAIEALNTDETHDGWAPTPSSAPAVVPVAIAQHFAAHELRGRWLDVLWLDYQGQRTRDIAELFTISPATIDDYWKKVGRARGMRKRELQVWFRAELELMEEG